MTQVVKQVQRIRGLDSVEDGAVYGSSPEFGGVSADASFLQTESSEVEVGRHNARSLRAVSAETQKAKKAQIKEILRKESRRLNSAVLLKINMHLNSDTFDQVKELIQELIERLNAEANQEANQKGFCDKNLLESANARDSSMEDVNEVNADLSKLNAKEDELLLEIEELKKYVSWLGLDLADARKLRLEEKAENMETMQTSKDAINALKMAIDTFKSLYKQTEKRSHTASYEGDQEGVAKVQGLLVGMLHNFESMYKETAEKEKKHERVFVNYYGVSSEALEGKKTTEHLDEDSLAGTRIKQAQALEDLENSMKLLDEALKELKGLVPMCLDSSMSYAERVAKREAEISALKSVNCVLAKGTDEQDELCKA